MFVDLTGFELSNNTRPTVHYKPPLTDEMTLDTLVWTGMSIDQLRERVLSVYIGRAILLVTDAMYANDNNIGSKV